MTRLALVHDAPVEGAGRPPWHSTHGTFLAGRAALDGLDAMAAEMEAKWGADRLRLLVSDDLREKFDRQRFKLNQASAAGELEDVRREASRMRTAWEVLDRAAEHAGQDPLSPRVWEVALENGDVVAIAQSDGDVAAVRADGRKLAVYTLEEIGRLIQAWPDIAKAKLAFPGATVTAIRKSVVDPLLSIEDRDLSLDQEIPL